MRTGRKHERIHQCIRCEDFDVKDSYCLGGGKDIYEPMKLIYCPGFKPRALECVKLAARCEEWNAIFPFMEFLQEKKIQLAHTVTKREYYGEDYEDELMETMVPIPQSLVSLLYEYFDVDQDELERERRKILESLGKGDG